MYCLNAPHNMWMALLGRPYIYLQHLYRTFFSANSAQIRVADSPFVGIINMAI